MNGETEPIFEDSPASEPSKESKSLIRDVFTSPSFFLATGAGLGLSPVAPGTIGALLGLPLAWVIFQIPGWPLRIVTLVLLNLIGVPICRFAAERIGKKDPGSVVWDEIATVPMTFLFVEPSIASGLLVVAVGFGLHRLFDISKFPPAKQLESLPNGLGIMADDWAAGIYSCLALHLILMTGILGSV